MEYQLFYHKKLKLKIVFENSQKWPKYLSSKDFQSLELNNSESMWKKLFRAILKMGGGRLFPHVQTG